MTEVRGQARLRLKRLGWLIVERVRRWFRQIGIASVWRRRAVAAAAVGSGGGVGCWRSWRAVGGRRSAGRAGGAGKRGVGAAGKDRRWRQDCWRVRDSASGTGGVVDGVDGTVDGCGNCCCCCNSVTIVAAGCCNKLQINWRLLAVATGSSGGGYYTGQASSYHRRCPIAAK